MPSGHRITSPPVVSLRDRAAGLHVGVHLPARRGGAPLSPISPARRRAAEATSHCLQRNGNGCGSNASDNDGSCLAKLPGRSPRAVKTCVRWPTQSSVLVTVLSGPTRMSQFPRREAAPRRISDRARKASGWPDPPSKKVPPPPPFSCWGGFPPPTSGPLSRRAGPGPPHPELSARDAELIGARSRRCRGGTPPPARCPT